jgi:molybdenum cofactor cytidylyltransferase
MIAGLLLAAGFGRRFDGDKLIADLRGRPLIRWSAEWMKAACDSLLVVVPVDGDSRRRALDGIDVAFVENAEREEGIASSIRVGIAALPAETNAVFVGLADIPFVAPEVISRMRQALGAGDVDAVVPMHDDGPGHPVLLARSCFERLQRLRGDAGAKALIAELGDRVLFLRCAGDAPPDVDDLATLQRLNASTS